MGGYMKTPTQLAALVAAASLGSAALAQEQQTYIYATYYYCDVSQEDRADEIFAEQEKPRYEQAAKDGLITGWGWLAHHTGGKWRRVAYHSAGSVVDLLTALDALGDQRDADEGDALGEICNSHDDYIWHGITGSGGDVLSTDRGAVGLSAYYECDSREPSAARSKVRRSVQMI